MEQDKEIAIESIKRAEQAIVVIRRNGKLEFTSVGEGRELEDLRLLLFRRLHISIITGSW